MGRTFLLTVVTLAIGVVAYWPTVRSLVGYWEDTDNLTYTHGYLIAAISVWLIWRARNAIEAAGTHPCWPGIAATATIAFVWYLAWISGLDLGHQVLFPLILIAAVAGVVGWRAAIAASFGIGYLYFAVPIWTLINAPLQSLTTIGVTALIRVTGVPAYIEGNFIFVPSGSFEIADGCSGLHFFIVALAIAALYGELDRDRLRNRLLLLGMAAVMAIVMNWIRVYSIILNGHLTDMQGYLVAVDHYKFGWLLFAVLLAVYFWLARRFLPLSYARQLAAPIPGSASVSAAHASIGLVTALAALAVGPALSAVAARGTDSTAEVQILLPSGKGDWEGPQYVETTWSPSYPQADAESLGEYRRGAMNVAVYVNSYAYQSQGHEVAGSANNVLGSVNWKAGASRTVTAERDGARIPHVEITVVAPDGERWVLGYFYAVGGRIFSGQLSSKLYYGLAVLHGRPRSGVVAVAVRCGQDCAEASAALNDFVAVNGRPLADTILRE